MAQSERIGELAKALSMAQAKIGGAKRDSENPFFHSTYADLQSVWEACREALSSSGLAVVQLPANDGDLVVVETILAHSSGEWISSRIAARPAKADAQGIGSVISYLRRYALAAIVGVYQVDDDAEAGVGRTSEDSNSIVEAKPAHDAGHGHKSKSASVTMFCKPPTPTLSSLWARAQRAGIDEATWRDILSRAGVTRDRSTHTPASMSWIAGRIDSYVGTSSDAKRDVSGDKEEQGVSAGGLEKASDMPPAMMDAPKEGGK